MKKNKMKKTRIHRNKSRASGGASKNKGSSRRRPDGPIIKAVNRLARLCGADKSESASEAFVQQLYRCAGDTIRDIDESHAEGLCLDATGVLGERLEEL